MPVLDKWERNIDLKVVSGEIPVKWRYTLGAGGERFFRALKEEGKILASYCPGCKLWFLPPAIFCERCFSEMEQWKDVGLIAEVKSYTIAHYSLEGERLAKPEIYAFLVWEGVEGGLIHRLGEIEPKQVKIGMKVRAKLAPKTKRKGLIGDILYFAPGKSI